jgi:catechol 2,3-dioxygenase-like lactoylglutathione lyase family enzyme
MTLGVNHVAISVPEMERTLEFYSGVLCFEKILTPLPLWNLISDTLITRALRGRPPNIPESGRTPAPHSPGNGDEPRTYQRGLAER